MAILTLGNKLKDEATGNLVRLKGVSVQDPLWQRFSPGPRLLPHGTLSFETARSWGANAVRVPFHPVTIRHAGGGDWLKGLGEVSRELDWILQAAKALELWVVIDFHAIGFPALEMTFEFDEAPYENLYECSQFEIESFWRHIVKNYGDHPTIAAFELYNEAERDAAFGNPSDWNLHAAWAEQLLRDIIRPHSSKLAIVGGLHFGYDLEGALSRPIVDFNLAYASHPYPHHSQAKSWDRAFGKVAERSPVILTEIGFSDDGLFGRNHHRGFRDWELEIQSFADSRELSFFAWNLSASWEPSLLRADDLQPNEAGTFFRDWISACGPTSTEILRPKVPCN